MNKTIPCETRGDVGSAQARRARRAGKVPAVLYGADQTNVNLFVAAADVERIVTDRMRIVSLELGGEAVDAMLKEIQYDVYGDIVFHMDFQRLVRGEKVEVHLPIRLKGAGERKASDGAVEQHLFKITLLADPMNLPDEIVFDVSGLKIGDAVEAGDLPLPEGAELQDAPNENVATVVEPEEEDEVEPEVEAETMKEPEVLAKGKKEEAEEE